MALLVATADARRVLEIGTLFGYSAIWIARALVDGGTLETIESEPLHADAAEHWLRRAGLESRVVVHRGPALEALERLPGPYDLVFVDADKATYGAYARAAIDRLRPGGILVADNVLSGGRIADPDLQDAGAAGIRALHDVITADPELRSTVVPIGDGLSLSVKRRGRVTSALSTR